MPFPKPHGFAAVTAAEIIEVSPISSRDWRLCNRRLNLVRALRNANLEIFAEIAEIDAALADSAAQLDLALAACVAEIKAAA